MRWVATDLDWRRQGLARALLIGALTMAQQEGCLEARLHTTANRLAAIPLYLPLGFDLSYPIDSGLKRIDFANNL